MNQGIEVDTELLLRPISLREKIGIQILLIIFRMVYPVKYEHQVKQTLAPLYELLEKK